MQRDVVRKILRQHPKLRERIEGARAHHAGETIFAAETERFHRVIRKLAMAHAAYELSTRFRDEPDVAFVLLPLLSQPEREVLDAAHFPRLLGESVRDRRSDSSSSRFDSVLLTARCRAYRY